MTEMEKAVVKLLNEVLPKWDETSDPVYRLLATEAYDAGYAAAREDAVDVLACHPHGLDDRCRCRWCKWVKVAIAALGTP